MTSVERFVEAVRSRGSDAHDVRDAAHEACHAIAWKVRGKWTRDRIHAQSPKVRSIGISDEITARAVEQLVCLSLGVKCWTVREAATICFMETMRDGVRLPSVEWLEDAISDRMKADATNKWSLRVLALAKESS